MSEMTKNELLEKLLKLLQADRDMTFLHSLEKKDLTTLLVVIRERIEAESSLKPYPGKRNIPYRWISNENFSLMSLK